MFGIWIWNFKSFCSWSLVFQSDFMFMLTEMSEKWNKGITVGWHIKYDSSFFLSLSYTHIVAL